MKEELKLTPGFLVLITVRPFTEMWKFGKDYVLGRKSKNSILDMLNLKRLLDIRVAMPGRQLAT